MKMKKMPFIIALTLAVGVLSSCGPNEVKNQAIEVNDQAIRLGNNGRAIVKSIIWENLCREALSMEPVWPNKSANFIKGQPAGSEYNPATSDEYFADLIANEALDEITWSDFAGEGIPAARNEEEFRAGGKNAWSCIVYPDETLPDDMPFLFTKNLRITNEDLRNYNPEAPFTEKLDESVKPLRNQKVVIVTKSGSVKVLDAKDLQHAYYFFDSTSADIIRKATVVHPK